MPQIQHSCVTETVLRIGFVPEGMLMEIGPGLNQAKLKAQIDSGDTTFYEFLAQDCVHQLARFMTFDMAKELLTDTFEKMSRGEYVNGRAILMKNLFTGRWFWECNPVEQQTAIFSQVITTALSIKEGHFGSETWTQHWDPDA